MPRSALGWMEDLARIQDHPNLCQLSGARMVFPRNMQGGRPPVCGFGLKSQQSTLTLWVGLGTRAYEPLNRSAQASSLPSLFCTSAVRPARRLVGSELDGTVDSLRSPGGLQGSVLHRQKPGCHSALARVGPPLSGLVPTPSPATLHSRPYLQPRLLSGNRFPF